jgi:hypothetical protein
MVLGAVQVPRIASVDYYGLRKIPQERIERALGLKAGDLLPPSKADVEDRIEKVPGVVLARLEAVCCEGGKGILFVGIEEKGTPHFNYRTPPTGAEALPDDLVQIWRDLLTATENAARRGSTAEDLTHGHPLMADLHARAIQERLVNIANERAALLKAVLYNSSNDEHRAIAATILGYVPDKSTVIDDLEYALQDPSEGVRASAMRSLKAIAVLARLQPGLRLRIHPTWFVEMLNSIVLSDRTRALDAMVTLTDSRDENTLALLRERSLPALAEMAQWKSLPHALPAFILLGRAGGIPEDKIQEFWSSGDRATLVQQVMAKKKKQK